MTCLAHSIVRPAARRGHPAPSTDRELRDLMVAYQQGDIGAFDRLYDELRPMLLRFTMMLARDAAWADDLIHPSRSRHPLRHGFEPRDPAPSPPAVTRTPTRRPRRTSMPRCRNFRMRP